MAISESHLSQIYVVSEPEAGRKIIRLLRMLVPGVPSSRLFRALRTGEVRVNDRKVPADYEVRADDRIVIPPFAIEQKEERRSAPEKSAGSFGAGPSQKAPRARGIRVLYEDGDYLVLYKPSGFPVHGGSGITGGTLVKWVRDHFAIPDSTYQPSPVHRIDRPASGLVVFAKTLLAHQHLARIFAEKSAAPEDPTILEKVYLALVKGKPPAPAGTIELPIGFKKISSGRDSERLAVSGYRVVAQNPPVCLLELRPVHGRTHQLRLHLSAAGMPILGDRRYGGEFPGVYRPMLHLWRLKFPARSGKKMSFMADPPADFVRVMKRFGLSLPGFEPPAASSPPRQPPVRRKRPQKSSR